MADGDQVDSNWIQSKITEARGAGYSDNEIAKYISDNFPQFAPEAMGLAPPPSAPVAPGLQGPPEIKRPSEKQQPDATKAPEPGFGQRFVAGVKRGIPALNQPGGGYHPLAAQEQQAASAFAGNKPLFKGYGAEDFYNSPVGKMIGGDVGGGLGEATPTLAPLIAGAALSRGGGRTGPVTESPAETTGNLIGPAVETAAPYVGKAAKIGGMLGGAYNAFMGKGGSPGKLMVDALLAAQGLSPTSPIETAATGATELAGKGMQAVPRVAGNILPTRQGLLPGETPQQVGGSTPPPAPPPVAGPTRVTTQAWRVPPRQMPATAGPGAPPPGSPPIPMPAPATPQLPAPGGTATPPAPPMEVGRPYVPIAGELPAAPIQMPAPEITPGPTGQEGVLPAQYRVVKNPVTGKMTKQYVTSPVPEGGKAFAGYGTGYEAPQGQAETSSPPQENLVNIPPEAQTPAAGAEGRGVEETKAPEEKAPEPKPGAKSRGRKPAPRRSPPATGANGGEATAD